MASLSSQWENLPQDVFFNIANRLHPDYRCRLTAVCKTWESQARETKLPGLKSTSLDGWSPIEVPSMDSVLGYNEDEKRQYVVNKSTIYCVYPPGGGSGKRNGWMFKVSKTDLNSDNFSLLVPLSTEKIKAPIGNFPKTLSGLYSTVICSSYSLAFLDRGKTQIQAVKPIDVRRTIVLQNYILGCDLVVLILRSDGKVHYWKRGDVSWTILEADEDYMFNDVVLYEQKCYATDKSGVLFLIDSLLRVTEIIRSAVPRLAELNSLVVGLNSELYMVQKIDWFLNPEYCNTTPSFHEFFPPNGLLPMFLKILKLNKKTQDWEIGTGLDGVPGDQVLFLGDDVTFSVSFNDFDGFHWKFVYLTHRELDNEGSVYGKETGVYDSYRRRVQRSAIKNGYAKCYWPPPSWLMMEDFQNVECGNSSSGSFTSAFDRLYYH